MKPKLRKFLKIGAWVAGGVLVLAVAGGVTVAVLYSRYEERAAKFDLTKIGNVAERSAVYDGNGEFYSFFGGENRLVVPLSGVSKHFLDALLAREDSRFWEHRGVDWRGIARALVANMRAGETQQGGSTITQQLARNACGLGERSIDRKALEAVLARRIETQYSKPEILELYVNRIYFGSGYYGIETAARGYFDKPAADLSLGESAALAALIRNPKRLAPTRDLDAASEGRNSVLARMAELNLITSEELAAAQAQQLKVAARNDLKVSDDAIMDAVGRELSTLLAPATLEYGGLRVTMTIDPALQRMAEAAADRHLAEIEAQKGYTHPRKKDFVPEVIDDHEKPTDYLQAAVVLIDNRTGAIRAAVGGRDYTQSKYQRALVAKRQIGSTFKPFVYATAFERGLLPGTMVDDSRIAAGEFKDLPKKWSPENSDGEYGGLQPASFGLLKSRNTMSVRVGEYAGLPKVREIARQAGLSDSIPDLPVVFLGAFESTACDIAGAYSIFPNQGIYHRPHLITKIEDSSGQLLWETPKTEQRVLSAESTWMITSILEQAMKSGTAAKAGALGWKKVGAGKTGTTNDFYDAWFVGYTSSMTCSVWVGMDQPQTIMEKGYGSALALPIWVEVMQQVSEKDYPAAPFTSGVEARKATLCSVSGERANPVCVAKHLAYEVQLPVSRIPTGTCRTHVEVAPVVAVSTAMPLASPSENAANPSIPASPVTPSAPGIAPVSVVRSLPPTVSPPPVSPPSVASINRGEPPTPRAVAMTAQTPEPRENSAPPVMRSVTDAHGHPRQVMEIYPQQTVSKPTNSTVPTQRVSSTSPHPSGTPPDPAAHSLQRPTHIEMAAPRPTGPGSVRDVTATDKVATRSSASTSRASYSSSQAAATRPRETGSALERSYSGKGVEVRRATLVNKGEKPAKDSAILPPATLPPGVSERKIVETLPDGRVRTTTIRSTRGRPAPESTVYRPMSQEDKDDD